VVAAEGDEVAEELTALLGVPADRVVVTPNGRDPDRFRPRDRSGDDGRPVVCFVGALTDGKQPLRYVEAVAGARRAGAPPFRALLVGAGPLADRVGPAAASAGVEWLGARGDVDELLGGADVLVFPSLPTGEGMPGVLIEAGLSGLAVVATDVPGVRSVVEDGTTGVVVPSGDAGALTDALVGLLTDGDRRAALGRAARERCVSRFTLDEVAARWLSLLGPLLDRAG
jgi:glycosyltransferase involved in cell wall biosynthesis